MVGVRRVGKNGLNPKFEEYAKGFKEVFVKRFGREPVMRDYVYNGWLCQCGKSDGRRRRLEQLCHRSRDDFLYGCCSFEGQV